MDVEILSVEDVGVHVFMSIQTAYHEEIHVQSVGSQTILQLYAEND